MVKQITDQELKQNVKYEEKTGIRIKKDGKWKDTYDRFAFFHPSADALISTNGYVIPLKSSNYGFPNSKKIRINRNCKVTGFSVEAEKVYNKLFEKEKIPLNEALEIIGACVNDSMKYDVDAVLNSGEFEEGFKNAIKNSEYKTRGDETINGICGDAGDIIRTLLEWTLIDPNLRYVHVASDNVGPHDTTLVLDIENGNWVVINSKSPLKHFNLTPKEKLQNLGYPYYKING